MGIFFSIIIPVYNGEQYIENCLGSIYRQGLREDDFEVICVDDASTDHTVDVISNYARSHYNLRLITHESNRRQGGARNTGIKVAKGDYILYIDADDTFESNALSLLKKELERCEGIDILKFDYFLVKNGVTNACVAVSDNQEVMSGREFLKKNSIPWVPWLCAYCRRFLLDNNLFFEENVLFEDADYVIDCIRHAVSIKYVPVIVYRYRVYNTQTSQIGTDIKKIIGLFDLNERIKALCLDEKERDYDVAAVINGHYEFRFKSIILRYWWHLSYKDRKELLVAYKPMQPCEDKLLSFIGKYPRLFLMTITVVKPLLPVLRYLYLKINDRKS